MRRAAVMACVFMLALPPAWAWGGGATAVAPDGRSRLQQVLDRLRSSRQRLREVRRQERRVLSELEDLDRSQEDAFQRLAAVQRELATSRAAAQAAATRLAAVERARQARRERLRGRLRALYLHGRTGYVDVLLGSADVGEFVARWQIVSTIVGADTRLIQEYTRDVEEQRAALAALTQAQARLAAIAEETARRRREVEAREEAKRGVLARLRQERAAYERMVRELEEDSRQLEALIRRSQSAGRRRVAMARGLPGFIWPARGIFTSGFGVRRHPIFRIRRLHTGQDIAAPYGAPVVAAADGRVIYTGWFGGYGRIVVLDHGEGVSTLYAHLSQILARSGQAVRKGQAIGRVGSTGYSTGPHVHFEVRVHGTPIDPARR